MKLCESINEELDKSKIKALAKSFIDGFKNVNDDGFEISEIDGQLIVDGDGEVDSDDTKVSEVEPLEDFKEILDEWSEEEGDSKLDDKDIKAIIKEIKGMEITRSYNVPAFKAGPSELEDAGESEEEFNITLVDFKYDSKKDILTVTKVK